MSSGHVWIKKRFTFAAVSAASTTGTAVTLHTTRGNECIHRVIVNRITDFAGGAVSAATVIIGKSGSTNKYLTATDVFTGVSNGMANAVVGTTAGVEVAGVSLIATVVTTTANADALTAGELEVFIEVSSLGA